MNIEENAHRLRILDDGRDDPPRVDLGAAMAEGRRRRRTRHIGQAAISVVAVAAVLTAVPVGIHLVHDTQRPTVVTAAGPSSTPTVTPTPTATTPTSLTCVQTLLSVPHKEKSLVTGGDPTGRYLLGRSYPGGGRPQNAVIWDNGTPHAVTIAGSDASLDDITSAGVAVGSSWLSDSDVVSWVYDNGKLTRLKGPAGSQAIAIGADGTIAGTENLPQGVEQPIVWRSATSTAKRLSVPGAKWSGQVNDVDDDGTIVGTVATGDIPTDRGIIWRPDGSSQLLPVPDVPGATGMWAKSIRHGIVIGQAIIPVKDGWGFMAVAYDVATGAFTDLPGATVLAGNADHWVVGNGPSLWTPGTGLIKLPSTTSTNIASMALTISDNGTVIGGQDTDKKGVIHAVEWRCH